MLNDFFVNIITQIQNDQVLTNPLDTKIIDDFVSTKINNFVTQYNIPSITVEQVNELINNLSCSKATGVDGISVKILKLVSPVFSHPLTKLLNMSLDKGIFPTKWKIARVITPLHKSGLRDDKSNYRPISLLPVISKICEKHVARSVMDYFTNNGLLYERQSAFRKGHSTETALINLTDQILLNMDKDEVTLMAFVDFKKAFDLIDHQVLLSKLHLYRVADSAIKWFTSYLTGRSQFVTIDGQQSSRLPVNHGVPQGSVLGPILFLLYVNDIPLHLSHSSVDIFPDDTTLSASTHWNDIPSMVHDINCDLAALNQWSIQNKMSINDEKTKFMLISGKRLEKKILEKGNMDIAVKVDDTQITEVNCQKLLGVTIDNRLNYEEHIDYVGNYRNSLVFSNTLVRTSRNSKGSCTLIVL
ncbi:Hypothetical predicted protein [Paramuricea clavata]|uniref:Uncharacterized protein n=1 Tax=Paramuricea clavata TaxID=317549 RepID=A0A6S7I803_PARCT|nr:Hypothetical predicted protein [Paramuricea clavata]